MTQPRLLGGRYELDGVIGRGGMAEVYKARDLRLDRIVAIKTLRSDLARDPTFQARFRREAQSAASLNHPSVIAVYDTGEDMMGDSMIPYIVMEFVEGHTLRELLRDSRRLVPERALEITDGILRALDYSHRGGIIHRDIKPANVMLTRNHEVKVMDFGIARAMADSAATMTQTAQVIGTAQYLSPEQARGERVDARSDLYSTGCVLYELLTGRPPFTGDSPVAIAYQHVREEPVPPSQVDPNIPHWCDPIVLKAMAKDANDRYQNANEFRADIQRALQGQPVSATASSTMVMSPGTQVMPPPTTVDRHPGYAQTQAGGAGYDQPGHYDEYEDERRRGGTGKKVALWVALAVLFIGGAGLVGVLMSSGGGGSNKAGNTPPPSTSASSTPSTAQVQVPTDLVGKTKDDASTELKNAGLTVSVTSQSSSSVPKDQVISSDPSGGTSVDKGSSVTLTVSSGPANQPVNVPDVSGSTFAQAKTTLQNAHLKVQRGADQSSDTVPKGQVISTNPTAGTSVPTNSTVTVTVSSGSQTVTVPDVTHGYTPKAACDKIRAAGLQCTEQDQPTPGVTSPTVTGQNPPGGTQAARNETVTITVATPIGGNTGQPNG